jgi:hypothetical protein
MTRIIQIFANIYFLCLSVYSVSSVCRKYEQMDVDSLHILSIFFIFVARFLIITTPAREKRKPYCHE